MTLDLVRRWQWFFLAVRGVASPLLEVCMIALSFYAANLFLFRPDYFAAHPHKYAWFVQHITSHVAIMGAIAMVAASLMTVGLTCLVARRSPFLMDIAFGLRELGWGLSVVFWGALAVGLWKGDPEGLGVGVTALPAVFAFGIMLAGPTMPDDRE